MTAQTPDRIVVDGAEWHLLATPLDPMLADRPLQLHPRNTGNWRGYVADWRVVDGWLYLDAATATIMTDHGPRDIDGAELVGRPLPMRADFVTGQLRIGRGPIVRYVHGGFASRWEHERIITVEGGRLTGAHDLARAGAMGSAGPYVLHEPLLGDRDLSGGAFGQLVAATDVDGRPLVAKVARRQGGGLSATEIFAQTPDGPRPVHVPAMAFRQHTGGAPYIDPADEAELQAVLHNEAEILERDTGRLLPRSLGIWEHDPSGLPVLVMERLEGRQPSTPADVVAVLDALAEAAERGTFDAHGDVKVEHIFIDGQRVRLCDPAPRFAAADRRGFTPLYNPYGYIGPAADVAACATVLRYLPGGGTAGWRWCDEVLRGPAPPPFASSHRAALDELRKALSANEPPPPGWTVPPLPERTGYFSRSAQPGPPVLPVPPPDPPSDGGYLPPVLTPTHTWPPSFPPPLPPPPPRSRLTYSAVALALHASSVIEAEDPADALFAPATPEAARSLTVLLDAMVTVTRGLAADGGSPVEYPGVTLLVQPGRLGGVEGVLARMMSMVPKHDVPLGDPLGAALGSAWNAAARLRLGEALAALDDAADLLHHVPHQGSAATATTDLVETARHIMSTLAVLRSHVERRLHGLS